MNSLPILGVLFALIAGFTVFNDLDASPSHHNDPCPDLWEICAQEANYASETCEKYGSDSNWCNDAMKDADKTCYAAMMCE